MATVISVINIKGGTAKTTTTFNLGAALAARNKKILTVDSDSQGSLTKAMGFTPLNCKVSLATLMCQALDSPELLEPGIKQAILHQNNIDLLPANQKLSGIATRLSVMQATASMFGAGTLSGCGGSAGYIGTGAARASRLSTKPFCARPAFDHV